MRCLSCKEYYGYPDYGTLINCSKEATKAKEELKHEIDDLKTKVAFLALPIDLHSPSFSDVVVVASDDGFGHSDAHPVSVPAHRAVLVFERNWKDLGWGKIKKEISVAVKGSNTAGTLYLDPLGDHISRVSLGTCHFSSPCFSAKDSILRRKASRSPVFRAMLENEMEESLSGTIKIGDVSCDALRSFVHYLYAAEASLDEQMASDLLVMAEKYQVKHLKTYCERYLVSKLNWENALTNFAFAHEHNAEFLVGAALLLIMDNMDKLSKCEGYMELVEKDPRLLVEIYEAYFTG